MASIGDKPKANTNAESRGEYRLPTDGPHRYVKKVFDTEKEKDEQPPYVIAVTKDLKYDEKQLSKPIVKYDPQELRSKAKMFLKSPNISEDQRDVMKEILGRDDTPKPT